MMSTKSTVNLLLFTMGLGYLLTFMSLRTTGRITFVTENERSLGVAPILTTPERVLRRNEPERQQGPGFEHPQASLVVSDTHSSNILVVESTQNSISTVESPAVQSVNDTGGSALDLEDPPTYSQGANESLATLGAPAQTEGNVGTAVVHASNATLWPPSLDHIADSEKRIILLIVNCGYIDMADNLIQSLLALNVTNFVLVPLDGMTHTTLNKIYPERVVPIMPGLEQITETATYGSEAFKALTSSRANIVHKFLEQGYTVFYCDLDMVWRKNALEFVANETDTNDYELVIVNDHNRHTVCSCFLYMKPTRNNLELLEMWNAEIQTGAHEQDQPAFQAALKAKSLHQEDGRVLKYLKIAADTTFIPSGKMYFRLWNDTVKEKVMIVHNNYIRGHDKKIERFANFSLWKPTGNLERVSYSCKTVKSRRLESCSAWLHQVEKGKRRMRR